MARSSSFRLEAGDLDGLRRALRAIDSDLPRKIVPGALKRGAEQMYLPAAKSEAPVGDPSDYVGRSRPGPGRTRDSVRVLATQTKVRLASGYKRLPYVQPNYWGWEAHNIEPNPYMNRAIDRVPANAAGRVMAGEVTSDIQRRLP